MCCTIMVFAEGMLKTDIFQVPWAEFPRVVTKGMQLPEVLKPVEDVCLSGPLGGVYEGYHWGNVVAWSLKAYWDRCLRGPSGITNSM